MVSMASAEIRVGAAYANSLLAFAAMHQAKANPGA
jgi:hypothetical protein